MMDETARRALSSLRFDWAPSPDTVWRSPPCHVDGLNREALELILTGFGDAERSPDASPLGVVLVGQRGSGKTHILSAARERVQADGGYFFLVSLLDSGAFWHSTILSILDGLLRAAPDQAPQLSTFLHGLADRLRAPRSIRRAATGQVALTLSSLDAFMDLLHKADRQVAIECQDTARALVLLASASSSAVEIGHGFLLSNDEEQEGDRAAWGIKRAKRSAQEIVRDVSRLLALTGPSLIAVDQIDLLVAQARHATASAETAGWRERLLLEQIASGLMSLREWTRRALIIISCLPHTWEDVRTKATDTVQDRFRPTEALDGILTVDVARELVERHVEIGFRGTGFTAPYPTWPVTAAALDEAVDFTPRGLLIAIDAHVRGCLRDGEVRELTTLLMAGAPKPLVDPEPPIDEATLSRLDACFAELRAVADPLPALDVATEDAVVPELLAAGLTAWIAEREKSAHTYSVEALLGAKPALHARLLRSLGDDHEDEAHWSFRAIGASHAIASLNRLKNAMTAAGLTEGVNRRKLFILRTDDWSPGVKTRELVETFDKAGGQKIPFPSSDVKIMMALRELLRTEDAEMVRAWCAKRRPARDITVLQVALPRADEDPTTMDRATTSGSNDGSSIVLGRTIGGGDEVRVPLDALRRHTVIFAGSGSGKTVLIRRIVEECALQCVSAIVLDPNNDLARLGDPWPEQPSTWDSSEAAKADEYLRHTDVVVWTPRREGGRPLSFQPLPDFSDIVDDPDEFVVAVDASVAALAPRAKVDGRAKAAQVGQAVLRQSLTSFARHRGSRIGDFITMLSDLPADASALRNAHKIAGDLAQSLAAAMVNDPLFGGNGTPMDPGVLLTPADGKRARVSVISFVGLPAEEQRQSFVNQLQLALFAWIRRNPAGDRPLGGLLVMDEAQTLAPSGAMTACTQSTLALASQARKYGLGLVFATQAPKGIHNRIPGNAATQMFGLLNSPVHIAAARDLARAKGTDVPDIAHLNVGEFYASVAGGTFEKIQTPLSLSHHPSSALTTEEVLARARPTKASASTRSRAVH